MTTPAQEFNQAYADLTGQNAAGFSGANIPADGGALNEYSNIEEDYTNDAQAYNTQLGNVSPSKNSNPWALIYLLIGLLMSSGSNVLSDAMGKNGASEKVEVDVNKMDMALQKMTTDTQTTAGNNKTILLDFANGTKDLMNLCTGGSLDTTLGASAASTLASDLQPLNQMVYTGGTVPTSGCYFDATGTLGSGYMNSFAQMNANASQQNDPDNASAALSLLTTNFGTNSSMLSGVAAQQNVLLKALTNALSTIQSFGSDMAHGLSTVSGAAIQNTMRG